MIKLGITGTIGSGKTIVSRILEIIEIPVYNADDNAKKIMLDDKSIRENLVKYFGEEVYNGNSLNKKLLSERIFSSDDDRKYVNSIVHPKVISDFQEWSAKQASNIVAIESALLYEAGIDKIINYIIDVQSPNELVKARLKARDNISVAEIEKRINVQLGSRSSQKNYNFAILNDENNSVIEQILYILKTIKAKYRQWEDGLEHF
jgi:dephospho-CoA kinase